MPIFRLERLEGDDISKAKLVIAEETNLELEKHLEDWFENSPRALTQHPLLWIGRQTGASVGESSIVLDLLGVDAEGNLVVVELKRDEVPRETIAQLLEYATWADGLSYARIREIAEAYFESRDEFKGKTFPDAFREMFDLSETDEFPPLDQGLRLFIIAEQMPARIVDVCRFLRTSHGMDLNCIDVSTFQTEAGEMLVSMETKVGNEDVVTSKTQRQRASQTLRWSEDKPVKQVLCEAVQKLTKGDSNVEFTLKEVLDVILEEYEHFNVHTLRRQMGEGRVNDPAPNHRSVVNPDGKYWWIRKGVYRLYDPEKDKMKSDEEVDLVEQGTENLT